MSDDTAVVQALLDAVPVTGGAVYLPAQVYTVGDLRIGKLTYLHGDGEATVLQALPGASCILRNRDNQSRRTRIERLRLTGNSATGGTGHGIVFDHTGIAGQALHKLADVTIDWCAGDGLHLVRCGALEARDLAIERCDGTGLSIDGTSYDGYYQGVTIGNSGLSNVWASAGAYFPWLHSYFNGRLDASRAAVYIDNWATYGMIAGKIEDSPSHGLHWNTLGLNQPVQAGWTVRATLQNIGGDVVRIDHAHKVYLDLVAAGSDRRHATGILHLQVGEQNAGVIRYDPAMVAPAAPMQGNFAGNTVTAVAI